MGSWLSTLKSWRMVARRRSGGIPILNQPLVTTIVKICMIEIGEI